MCKQEGEMSQFKSMIFETTSATVRKSARFTNTEWRRLAVDAEEANKPLCGIKGPCQIMKLDYVDMSVIAPPESLHAIYSGLIISKLEKIYIFQFYILGVVKAILDRFFASDLSNKAWYRDAYNENKKQNVTRNSGKSSKANSSRNSKKENVYTKYKINKADIEVLNSRLANIKFPEGALRRMPQFDPEHRDAALKAFEYENVLFYGWICFEGLLETERFNNFKSLAYVISMLSARHIPENLRQVELEMDKFLDKFSQIYGKNEEFMFHLQIHYLSHFVDMVKAYGPLHVWSSFFTESTYGMLVKNIHSGTYVPQQLVNKYTTRVSALIACSKMVSTCSTAFLKMLKLYCPKICSEDNENPQLITTAKHFRDTSPLSPGDLELISKFPELKAALDSNSLSSLSRVSWRGETICTKQYNETKCRTTNNHCVKLSGQNNYYLIHRIFQTENNIWIFGQKLLNCNSLPLYPGSSSGLVFPYIKTFTGVSGSYTKLDPTSFDELATYVSIEMKNSKKQTVTKNYVLDLFNRHG